jgi:hypothetical protein
MSLACGPVRGGRRSSAGFGGQGAIDDVGLFLDKSRLLALITLLYVIVGCKCGRETVSGCGCDSEAAQLLERRTLRLLLSINAAMFVLEATADEVSDRDRWQGVRWLCFYGSLSYPASVCLETPGS